MRKIDFNYIKWWKLSGNFKELYHKQVSMKWILSRKCLENYHIDEYNPGNDKYDQVYIWMVEKECNEKYIIYYRGKDIRFTTSKKFVEKYKNLLYKFNFGFFPNQIIIYIWSSLKILLEKKLYKNYEWPVRIYWEFWWINTTKTNIGKIRKVEILDDKDSILDTIEK